MEFLLLLIPFFHLLGLYSAYQALMETRTSQGTIAWVLFLIGIPYIALPIYWIFGRSKFVGYRKVKEAVDAQIRGELETLLEKMESQRIRRRDQDYAGAVAEKLADLPYTGHNSVELLIDGEATFESILAGIDQAESYILFQFFIVHDDTIGKEVQRRLIARAREGVAVYFLYDEIGSHDLSGSYIQELRRHGIQVSAFNSRRGWRNKFQLNFRNHRKVVVVDGRYAWIGGHNVGDEYLGRDPKLGHWRDTHLKIEGPAVMGAQLSFAEDWYWATGQKIEGVSWEPYRSVQGDATVLVISSGPADRLETAQLMFLHAINVARKRLWIASPYFVPDDSVIYALQLAGLRGVDVRILIPERPDHMAVWLAAFSYFEEVGNTGVRFYSYTEGFLHEKVMLIDDGAATVGTANFDNRSFRLNFEITAVVEDEEFIREVEKMFLEDFAVSRPERSDILRTKPFWFRLAVRVARLSSPVL
ncbi:cardiolipin synthase [Nitratifractor sp.]